MSGPLIHGAVLSRRDVDFAGYVVTLTAPGAPRMPNGIECGVKLRRADRVSIGGGKLAVGTQVIDVGPGWDPVPNRMPAGKLTAGPAPLITKLSGFGAGLRSAADVILMGYVAGLVLLHGMRDRASRLAEGAGSRTDCLSATLLRHAALGEVPEPVHVLLANGDIGPLLSMANLTGHAWLRGLVSAGYVLDVGGLPAAQLPMARDASSGAF